MPPKTDRNPKRREKICEKMRIDPIFHQKIKSPIYFLVFLQNRQLLYTISSICFFCFILSFFTLFFFSFRKKKNYFTKERKTAFSQL